METYRMKQLEAAGYEPKSIRAGRGLDTTRVRHGGYVIGDLPDDSSARHRALIRTTLPLVAEGSVVSHASAGVLWGLPVPGYLLNHVHVTRPRVNGGGQITGVLHRHVAEVPDATVVDDCTVTGLARTAVEVSLLCRPHDALAVMDSCLRMGVTRQELTEQLLGLGRRVGVGTARYALQHADALAESPGESISRYWMLVCGVPEPVLQYEVRSAGGVLIGRVDFAWPEYGVLGEFDGRVKYEKLLKPGQSPADVVMAEKMREDELRRLGWWVLRWVWGQLRDGLAFGRHVNEFLQGKHLPARG